MKIKDYLSDKIALLCFYAIFVLMLSLILAIAGIHYSLILLLDGFLLLAVVCYLTVDFVLLSRRLKGLKKILDGVPDKHLIGEILPRPASAVEREYFAVMKTVSHGAVSVAEGALREKDEYCEFVENWVHEIKTPLTACSLILKNGADPVKLRRELKRAENQTESILYYARLKNVEKDMLITEFGVKSVIDEAVKSQREILTAAGLSVDVEGDFTVCSDEKSFCFILKQLLLNCAKYAPKGRIEITAAGGTVTVKDNGMGIPSHEVGRVTARGFTGTNGRAVGSVSTGMGLYIVNGLCEALDIKLTIESKAGEYTAVGLEFLNLTKL